MIEEQTSPVKNIKTFSIGNIELPIHLEFKQIAAGKGINQRELFLAIFNSYKNLPIEFDENETLILLEARDIAADYLNKKIKKLILRLAQGLIESKSKVPAEINLKNKSSAKAADARADGYIHEIIKHNENAQEHYDKVHINKTSIFDYAKKLKQSDANNISIGKVALERCLARNKELIDLHNAEHKLTSEHNLHAYHQRSKAKRACT